MLFFFPFQGARTESLKEKLSSCILQQKLNTIIESNFIVNSKIIKWDCDDDWRGSGRARWKTGQPVVLKILISLVKHIFLRKIRCPVFRKVFFSVMKSLIWILPAARFLIYPIFWVWASSRSWQRSSMTNDLVQEQDYEQVVVFYVKKSCHAFCSFL